MREFKLVSDYQPAGDQPQAIQKLVDGVERGASYQTLLGATGTGKTFTMANVIATTGRPTLVLAHNKTLAAQLYSELRDFFPGNAVEYFVSYYDYYQPEAYVPSSDTFIEKDASINEHIDQMRLSATNALLVRNDTIIVATVSAIFGLGNPNEYNKMILHLRVGATIDQRVMLRRLAEMQYNRNDMDLRRGTFRVRGDIIDIYPADSAKAAVRVELFGDEIEKLSLFDPLTGEVLDPVVRYTVFPKTHYVTARETLDKAIGRIEIELNQRLQELTDHNKLVEAQRLAQRTHYDVEMIKELGYCAGIENYSRHLSERSPGEAPDTLIDYLPKGALVFVDESHVTLPQLRAMYRGDRSRKETLVDFGFRLPSALDNRPLKFEEFEVRAQQVIFMSATPGDYEKEKAPNFVDQVVRPTGLVDPIIEIRRADTQVDDLLSEIQKRALIKERVLVTTLTKRMAEDLTDYLSEHSVRVRYLHSDIDTVERVEILRDLRAGVFDVLVGINLLREGLDIPEVSLVAILDADKEGFLRSARSLIQTIGRTARNINGRAILYADEMTRSMRSAIEETNRRRDKQLEHNRVHGILPESIEKEVKEIIDGVQARTTHRKRKNAQVREPARASNIRDSIEIDLQNEGQVSRELKKLERQMHKHAANLEFEHAARVRDQINELKELVFVSQGNV